MKSELISSLLVDFESCKNASVEAKDHFVESNKMIDLAKGVERTIDDVLLTRYAA